MARKPKLSASEVSLQRHALRESLPSWALAHLAARNAKRVAQRFTLAMPIGAVESVIARFVEQLETGSPSQSVLDQCHRELDAILNTVDLPPGRGPLVELMSICGDYASTCPSFGSGHHLLSKEQQQADRKLEEKTEWRDVEQLAECVRREIPRSDVSEFLGALWPYGEPNWARVPWPTPEQMKAINDRMWGEDAPEVQVRPARLGLSERLPEIFHDLLERGPFELVFRSEYEVSEAGGENSLQIYKPRDHKLKFPTPGRHGFREPADAEVQQRFRMMGKDCPSLRLLWAFYREHDGGVLFQPEKGTELDAQVYWHGLEDQEYAVGIFDYLIEDLLHRRDKRSEFLKVMGCDGDSFLVLMHISSSLFLVPLKGPSAGAVYRFMFNAGRLVRFADSVDEALRLITVKIPALSGNGGPMHGIGDEQNPEAVTQMKLIAVKPRTQK